MSASRSWSQSTRFGRSATTVKSPSSNRTVPVSLACSLPFLGGAGGVADGQSGIEAGLGGLVALQTLVDLALQDRQQLDRQRRDLGRAEGRQIVRRGGVLGEWHELVSVIGEKGLEGGHHAASSRRTDRAAPLDRGLGRATAM